MTPKSCGTCGLWARNFYTREPADRRGTTCCADAVMDLPASFKPSRQTMTADEGAECICWRPVEDPKPVEAPPVAESFTDNLTDGEPY